MAKIVQALTRASKEYDPLMLSSLVRDLDSVINKLNTSFQQELLIKCAFNAFASWAEHTTPSSPASFVNLAK